MALIDERYKTPLIIIAIIILALLAFSLLNGRDDRTTTEKLGDAVEELPRGVGPAERELQGRTPSDKLNDTLRNEGEILKENSQPQIEHP